MNKAPKNNLIDALLYVGIICFGLTSAALCLAGFILFLLNLKK